MAGGDEDGRARGRELADSSQVVAVMVVDDDSPGGP